MYPVFTVAQLEPCPPPEEDPFQRPQPQHIPPVSTNKDGSGNYKILRLLNKRSIKRGRGLTTQYLVRWKDYGPKFNKWYSVKDLGDASELIADYEEERQCIRQSNSAPAVRTNQSAVQQRCTTGEQTMVRVQIPASAELP